MTSRDRVDLLSKGLLAVTSALLSLALYIAIQGLSQLRELDVRVDSHETRIAVTETRITTLEHQ